MSCAGGCSGIAGPSSGGRSRTLATSASPRTPTAGRGPMPRRLPMTASSGAAEGGGGEVIEEVVEETVFETYGGDESQERMKVLTEDLQRVHRARRKLIADIRNNMPVLI